MSGRTLRRNCSMAGTPSSRHDAGRIRLSAHLSDPRVGRLASSVVTYFHGTSAGASIDRFWRNVIPPTVLLMIVAVWANRPALSRRKWLGAAGILFFTMLFWTAAYFVPGGVIPLMERGGEGMSPDEITRTARAWIFWDWFHMAGTTASYLCSS